MEGWLIAIIGVLLIVIMVLLAVIDDGKRIIKGQKMLLHAAGSTMDVVLKNQAELEEKHLETKSKYTELIDALEAKRQSKNAARRKTVGTKSTE